MNRTLRASCHWIYHTWCRRACMKYIDESSIPTSIILHDVTHLMIDRVMESWECWFVEDSLVFPLWIDQQWKSMNHLIMMLPWYRIKSTSCKSHTFNKISSDDDFKVNLRYQLGSKLTRSDRKLPFFVNQHWQVLVIINCHCSRIALPY